MSRPFDTVLIANRGEIALRIARTCRAMGLRTVAVYSDADVAAPHVRACDLAVRIGPPPARESYLRIDAVISAAVDTGAQAVHPGYGFLSENASFAQACADAGLVFVGPPASAIKAMGDKIAAKRAVEGAGVTTVPGYLGDDQTPKTLRREAERIGVPLLIKAAAGGGGKGMRVVRELDAFDGALEGAKREAMGAFGDDTVFLERYLEAPRHIEIQVLADAHGACIHLGERECSIQRRHQKVLEETPSTAVSPALRARMGDAAIRAARSVGYVNAGTVEFMLDADERFYFLEMNTRLQVEHAITEAVTGVDLVREQLRIAAGEPLALVQTDVAPRGHAIEVRIYAEDPEHGFLPSTGRIEIFQPPEGPGIRNDAGVEPGSVVSVDYDPMLAKLIAYDRTRDACIERLGAALDDYLVGGVITNIPFLRWVLRQPAFVHGETTTGFIDRYFDPRALERADTAEDVAFAAAAAAQTFGGWRHSAQARTVLFEGMDEPVSVTPLIDDGWRVSQGERSAVVRRHGAAWALSREGAERRFVAWRSRDGVSVALDGVVRDAKLERPPSTGAAARGHRAGGAGGSGAVEAPMSGKIVGVSVKAGDAVSTRDVLLVMEAMKMEHTILAPYDGRVAEVGVAAGDSVGAGDVLVRLEAGG